MSEPVAPGRSNTAAVQRLVRTIQTVRIILLILLGLSTIGGFTAGLATDSAGIAFLFLIYGAISAVTIYVMFGWFEHTLGLLLGIFRNTHPSSGTTY